MPHSLWPAVSFERSPAGGHRRPRYTCRMPQATAGLDVAAIQAALAADGLDALAALRFPRLNPIAAEVTGVNRRGGHLATRRWYYLIPASGEPRGLVHAIERDALDHLPGAMSRATRAATSSRPDCASCVRGVRRVAMEYSPHVRDSLPGACRCRHRRTGAAVRRRRRLVRRSRAAIRRRLGRGRHRDPQAGVGEALSHQGSGVRRRLRDGWRAGTPTTEYDIQQLMTGWFRDEGLVSDSPPIVAAAGNAGNPHYMPTAAESPGHPAGRDRAARPVGQTRSPRRGLRRHHVGRLHRRASTRAGTRRCLPPWRRRATRRCRWSQRAAAEGRARSSARLAGRSRRIQRCCAAPATATTSCTAPATASASRCTATASTWTTTKRTTTGGCSPARASRSSPASTSTTSACDRKSTCSSAIATQS